ncbi:MAG: flagellar assembly protein FliW [Clostridium sp.]|uniref:flagellar assembly protein FliW n=1 Tax=Clostridium sp. TaxID=1506 RepID=UPI003F2F0223
MEIKSKVHGSLEYKEENKIYFKNGILGFEELKEFAIIDIEDNELFKILHSLENMELSLIIMSPFNVEEGYEIKLNNKTIENLKIKKEEDVLLYTIVTLNGDIKKITTNMAAPLVININENLGEQVVLDNFRYKIKHPINKEK